MPVAAHRALTLPAVALAVTVAVVWGTNPVAIHEGLKQFPPLGGAAIRFLMVAVPLIVILPKPKIGARWIAAYGFLLATGLGLNNIAMDGHVSPGLASLLVQTQVVLTIGLELVVERRPPRAGQILALLFCLAGVFVILGLEQEAADALGVTLMIAAAASWAVANMMMRRLQNVSMTAMMVWSSSVACVLLALLALVVEGPASLVAAVTDADTADWSALIWQALASGLFGYACWNFLLQRYSASQVAPLALLVPIAGMAASALFVGETLGPGKLLAAVLIVSGMGFALLRHLPRKARSIQSSPKPILPGRNG